MNHFLIILLAGVSLLMIGYFSFVIWLFKDSFIYQKERGYKFWLRFKKPIKVVEANGCFDNSCGNFGEEGCKCNNYNKTLKELEKQGFYLIGTLYKNFTEKCLYYNGKDIIHCYYKPGR